MSKDPLGLLWHHHLHTYIAQRAYGGALRFCIHFTYLQHCLSAPSLICSRVLSHACAMWVYIREACMSGVHVTMLIRSQDQLTVCTATSKANNAMGVDWLALESCGLLNVTNIGL